jgi:hypothetical protein
MRRRANKRKAGLTSGKFAAPAPADLEKAAPAESQGQESTSVSEEENALVAV